MTDVSTDDVGNSTSDFEFAVTQNTSGDTIQLKADITGSDEWTVKFVRIII